MRLIGTYLYGRRLYETMAYWGAPVGVAERREDRLFTNADTRNDTHHGRRARFRQHWGRQGLLGLRSKPISSTNVICFSTRWSSALESRHFELAYDGISYFLRRAVSARE
jgi:hypothetical protein